MGGAPSTYTQAGAGGTGPSAPALPMEGSVRGPMRRPTPSSRASPPGARGGPLYPHAPLPPPATDGRRSCPIPPDLSRAPLARVRPRTRSGRPVGRAGLPGASGAHRRAASGGVGRRRAARASARILRPPSPPPLPFPFPLPPSLPLPLPSLSSPAPAAQKFSGAVGERRGGEPGPPGWGAGAVGAASRGAAGLGGALAAERPPNISVRMAP